MTTFNKPVTVLELQRYIQELDLPLTLVNGCSGVNIFTEKENSPLAQHLSINEAWVFIKAYNGGRNRGRWEVKYGDEWEGKYGGIG